MGALMLSMPCNHPEIEEFVDIKTQSNKVTKANISVRAFNDFMEAVEKDEDYILSFYRPETEEKIEKVIKARELFKKICTNAWDWGEPGFLFWDRIQSWNMVSNNPEYVMTTTNPCVTGDTLILTRNGYKRIDELVGKKIEVWNGSEFSEVEPKITGVNQEILDIEFSNGSTLSCTPYHKFYLSSGTVVEAKDLNIGDKLEKWSFPVIEGTKSLKFDPYTQGFYSGDGSSETNRKRKSIWLYGEKKDLIDKLHFKSDTYCPSSDRIMLTLENPLDKDFVPSEKYTVKTRLSWLAGLIDSDGSLNDSTGSIAISSVNKSFLLETKKMLETLGCFSSVIIEKEEGNRLLPDGNSGSKEYHCQASYRLVISAFYVKELMNLGLTTNRVELIANPNRNAQRFIQVVSVTKREEKAELVYCFNEPKRHKGCFNGVVTGQCGEQPLPDNGSCLLGSINLAEFVKDGEFDFDGFAEVVGVATEYMNLVLEEGLPKHPLQEQRDTVAKFRQIGLGIMGLGTMFMKLEVPYGSDESIQLSEDIARLMLNKAVRTSALIAKELGPYPAYNFELVEKTEFYKENLDAYTKDLVKQHGLRNAALLTVAPTGSLSTLLNITGGIEPLFDISYTRKTESLHGEDYYYKVYDPLVDAYMKQHDIVDENDLPEFAKTTALTLDYNKRIRMQAIWQKYIDSAISSTVNLPEETTVEDVMDLYMNAWKAGLKGITIFRSGCKRAGILTSGEVKDSSQPEELRRGEIIATSNDLIGMKNKLVTGCGSLHLSAFFDPETGKMMETYLSKGSTGGCNNFMVGLSRMISLALRGGVSLEDVVTQLDSAGTCPSYATRKAVKKDTSPGSSCPVAVGKVLLKLQEEMDKIKGSHAINLSGDKHKTVKETLKQKPKKGNSCPECGSAMEAGEGCFTCKNCGYSKCS